MDTRNPDHYAAIEIQKYDTYVPFGKLKCYARGSNYSKAEDLKILPGKIQFHKQSWLQDNSFLLSLMCELHANSFCVWKPDNFSFEQTVIFKEICKKYTQKNGVIYNPIVDEYNQRFLFVMIPFSLFYKHVVSINCPKENECHFMSFL